MMTHSYNLSTLVIEAGGSKVQGQSQHKLHKTPLEQQTTFVCVHTTYAHTERYEKCFTLQIIGKCK